MNITIHRDGTNYGPYTLEQANAMVASGLLRSGDLAWPEGAPQWLPLGNVPGVLHAPPPAPSAADAAARAEAARHANSSDKLILPAFLLAFLLGPLGLHRFYVGKNGSGLAMLVLSLTLVGLVVTGIWYLVDMIMIVCGAFTDANERRLTRWT